MVIVNLNGTSKNWNAPEFNVRQHELDRLLIITIGAVCIAALVLIAVIVLAIKQPSDPVWVKAIELTINASAAISTAAAAIIALHLGRVGHRRQDDEILAKALLVAASVTVRLALLQRQIRIYRARQTRTADVNTQRNRLVRMARSLVADDRMNFTLDELTGLIPLSAACPESIAKGIEILRGALRRAAASSDSLWAKSTVDQKSEKLAKWEAEVKSAESHLQSAVDLLSKTARKTTSI